MLLINIFLINGWGKKMNEEIEIKLNSIQEHKRHSIRINQDATVGDLINKIKESKEIVGNGQFLYLSSGKCGPNNGLLSYKESMNLKLSEFKINNDSTLKFEVFDINTCRGEFRNVLCRLLKGNSVVKIVQDGNIEIVFEKSIKCKSCLGRKSYSVLPMKLGFEIKDLITLGAGVAYRSYPIKNYRDFVYFKINFGDKIITDSENIDENESLENMAIKQVSVLNMEIATRWDDQKVLKEKGWVKAIDIINKIKVEQKEKENNVEHKEIKKTDENGKKQKNKDMAQEEKKM